MIQPTDLFQRVSAHVFGIRDEAANEPWLERVELRQKAGTVTLICGCYERGRRLQKAYELPYALWHLFNQPFLPVIGVTVMDMDALEDDGPEAHDETIADELPQYDDNLDAEDLAREGVVYPIKGE